MRRWWGAGAVFGLIVCLGAGCRRGALEPVPSPGMSAPASPMPVAPPAVTPPAVVRPPDTAPIGVADCSAVAAEAPRTLATVSDYAGVGGLFVDDDSVYFGAVTDGGGSGVPEASHGVLRHVPKDGGATEELWSGTGWVLGIGTTDEAIFLMTYDYPSRAGRVLMRARDGTSFAVVGSWSSMGTCGSLTTAGSDAFWTDITGSAGSVMHTTAAGLTSTLIAGADPCPGLATTRGGQVYWVDLRTDIRSLPIGGGDERLIWRAFSPQYARQLSITAFTAAPDGDLLFAAFDGRVLRLDPAARTVRTLLADRPGVGDLATDGALLYVADGGRQEIVAVPVDGGTPDTVASDVTSVAAVRADARYVYWIDGGRKTVMRAPKCAVRMSEPGAAGAPSPPSPAGGASACGAPAASVVASVSDHQLIGPIAVAGGFVTFGASTSLPVIATGPGSHAAGALRRVPGTGGPVEEVWTGDGLVRALAADGAAVYFVTGGYDGAAQGQSVHVALADPPHTAWTVAEMPVLELEPAIAAGHGAVFWTSSSSPYGFNGQVNRAEVTGTGATVIASDSRFDIAALALVGGDVYYSPLGTLLHVPEAGGTPTMVTTRAMWPAALAVSSAGVFWADGPGVAALELETGSTRHLFGDSSYLGVDGLAADADTVYVASAYTHQVLAVPATGGDGRLVACSPSPVSIAVDDEFVYWADQDLMQVLRAPK